MNGRNRDHVAIYPSTEALYWAFVCPSSAQTCAEQAVEMKTRCEALFESFGEFVVPTELSYHVHSFPEGYELPASTEDRERVEVQERQLQSEDGIAVEEFLDSAAVAGQYARWIPIVEFDRLKVKVRLEQGEVYADREHHCVGYDGGESLDETPIWDPLTVRIALHPNTSHSEIDAEYLTSLTVTPRSDLWFEDTDIGEANRMLLSDFLERVDQQLPVETVQRVSDWRPNLKGPDTVF